MRILAKTLLFILSKWDKDDLDILYPWAKVLLYVPHLINNILVQIFYFCLFPFVYVYFYLTDGIDMYFKLLKYYLLNK